MSFLTVVEQAAEDIDVAAVADAKAVINYIDNVTVTEIIPELEEVLMTALKNFTQQEIAAAIATIKAAI